MCIYTVRRCIYQQQDSRGLDFVTLPGTYDEMKYCYRWMKEGGGNLVGFPGFPIFQATTTASSTRTQGFKPQRNGSTIVEVLILNKRMKHRFCCYDFKYRSSRQTWLSCAFRCFGKNERLLGQHEYITAESEHGKKNEMDPRPP